MSIDLVVGTPTPASMNINDNGTLGTPVTLPDATTSDAGLMSALDKTKLSNAISSTGVGTFSKVGISTTLAAPTNFLDVDSGTNPGTNIITSFRQNNGSIQCENGTGATSVFAPTIRGISTSSTPWGILVMGQGASSYSRAGVVLRAAANSMGTGNITTGNTFLLQNNATNQLSVDYQGAVTVTNLAGTGTRMVIADSTGTLNPTTALIVDGSGNVVVSNNIQVSGNVTGIPGMGPLSLQAAAGVKIATTGYASVFNTSNVTADRTVDMPNASGTAAAIGTIAPASASDAGVIGEIRITSTYVYFCIATNTWVRAPFATW